MFVMPAPEEYLWGYWEIYQAYEDVIGALGDPWDMDVRGFMEREMARIPGFDQLQSRFICLSSYKLRPHLKKISLLLDALANEDSRMAYNRCVFEGIGEAVDHFWKTVFIKAQYFDYAAIAPGDVIINGGVCEGFELPHFLAHMNGKGRIYSFDPLGFDHLSGYAREVISFFPEQILEYRMALHDSPCEISLPVADGQALGHLANVQVKDCENVKVPATSVDAFVENEGLERVDLIKLDIEGGETFAIQGMIDTIACLRPQLVISIYHRWKDYVDIPLFLMQRCRDYKFYIETYSYQRFETILYAIPAERDVGRRERNTP